MDCRRSALVAGVWVSVGERGGRKQEVCKDDLQHLINNIVIFHILCSRAYSERCSRIVHFRFLKCLALSALQIMHFFLFLN